MPDPVPASLTTALAFADFGFGIFSVWGIKDGHCLCPMGEACNKRPGKHPVPVNGFKAHTTDPARITTMLSAAGSAGNYGVFPAENTVILDVDGEGWQEKLKGLGLPKTLTVLSANGIHLYFYWPPDYGPSPTHLFGWKVRSLDHEGYVVGPGSLHQSGVYYRFAHQNGHTNEDMVATIKPFPKALVPPEKKPTLGLVGNATITVGGSVEPETIQEGGRYDYLRDRARPLWGIGLTGEALFNAVDAFNQRFPVPHDRATVERAIDEERLNRNFQRDAPTYIPPTVVPVGTVAWETLETLPFGIAPKPLVLDVFVAPEGWTVLYANGGTGKGFLALWMLHQYLLAHPDKQAMVLDYEGHQWEWGNRARNMGWAQAERERVIYIDPYDPAWGKGHTLAGLAPTLRPHADAEGVGLFIVDSYSTAAGTGSEMGGLEGAVDFFKAGSALGAPGLVLAHTSSEEKFPKRPFGSVFVHNLARETWAGSQLEVTTGVNVPGQFGVTETVMQVELRNKKRSVGEQVTAGQVFDIGFRSTGAITVDYNQTYQRPLRDLIADVLSSSTSAMTAKQMSAAIKEDYDRDVSEEAIRKVIDRGVNGLVENSGQRPKTYSLSEEPGD